MCVGRWGRSGLEEFGRLQHVRKEARKVGLGRGGRGARVGPGGGCDVFAPGLALLVQVAQGGLEDGEGVAAVACGRRRARFGLSALDG
uniref:Uncharacterized protein n=1 Tax=Setaria italica TaxID=4555 RepID=K3YF76_SETIT